MTILIDDPTLDKELIEKSAAIGQSVEHFVLGAVRARLAKVENRPAKPIDFQAIRRLQEKVAALPVLDGRSLEEMLYDEDGMPIK